MSLREERAGIDNIFKKSDKLIEAQRILRNRYKLLQRTRERIRGTPNIRANSRRKKKRIATSPESTESIRLESGEIREENLPPSST